MIFINRKTIATSVVVFVFLAGALTPYSNNNRSVVRAGLVEDIIGSAGGCAAEYGLGQLFPNLLDKFSGGKGVEEVPVGESELRAKETIFDCLGWIFANVALDRITTATVNWINSGFEGNPAYVDDLEGFLKDTADTSLGIFIENSELEFLCSPFRVDIKAAILQSDRFDHQITCTLGDVVENIDEFVEGNFQEGGWRGWFELTQRPQNNPYGAYLMAKIEIDQRIADALNIEQEKLEWGQGFLSREVCEVVGTEELPEDQEGPPRPITECKIVTPGSVIDAQLNDVLTIGGRRLSVADELNEIAGALLTQLISKVLSSDPEEGGLRGASEFIKRLEEEDELTKLPDDDDLGGKKGDPTGSCDFGGATLSSGAQATVVDVSRFPSPGNGAQVVFQDGNQYRVDTRVGRAVRKFGPVGSISGAGALFCSANGPCSGGGLSDVDQQGVLKLDAWAESGGSRLVALRFETDGVHIDWFSSETGIGDMGPFSGVSSATTRFCRAAEEGGGSGPGDEE